VPLWFLHRTDLTEPAFPLIPEPAWGLEWILDRLASASECLMSAPTAVELGNVLEARVPAAVAITRRVLRDAQIEVVPFDSRLVDRASDAWRRFGKGTVE
jgi:ribonuclease VapC